MFKDKLIRCHICEAVNIDKGGKIRCRRCNEKIHDYKKISFHKTVAFLITAIILYIPANLYPILITKKFGILNESTILGGVMHLWEAGSYPVAIIILLASVFVPILKFIFLVVVLFVFYKKVIVPFSERMLEIPVDESAEAEPLLALDEDEQETLTEKFTQMRKKVEEQLGLTDEFNEDELKYEVLLEKMVEIAEERPEEVAALISALIRDETEMENNAANQMSGGKK